jgi:hypothetical protein
MKKTAIKGRFNENPVPVNERTFLRFNKTTPESYSHFL